MYGLRRGRQWICAPEGDGRPIPPVLAVCDTNETAWVAATLDEALERSALLRVCWGWATEVRAIR